jgi:hypothetical protein
MSQREQRSRNNRDTSSTYTIITTEDPEDEIVNRTAQWRINKAENNLADSMCSNASTSSTSSSSSSTILAPRPPVSTGSETTTQVVQEEESPLPQPVITTPQIEEEEVKRCWICFGEEEDSEGKWVKPCKCSLICHEECLLNWISENQKGQPFRRVEYHFTITLPNLKYLIANNYFQ